jgi:spermidine synthase
LGVSAFITQLTLMRELLGVFSGNELVLGIVLGNWLLLTGLGTYLGKTASRLRNPIGVLVCAQVMIGLLPLAQVFLLRTLRNVVFLRGAEVGVTETVAACFVLLAPYCLVAGYLLTLASLVLAVRREPSSIGQVYFLDNVGDVFGGVLFSFVLIYWLDHFRILYLPALLNLALAGAVCVVFGRRLLLAAVAIVLVALVGLILAYDLDRISAEKLYVGQRIVYMGNSPYGSLIVTESAGQHNFIENGVVLFSTQNVDQVEETVHYAMAQRPRARRVLLISGGVSGTAKEILRYGVTELDYVELDPQILRVAQRFLPQSLADPRIRVINADGRLYVRQTTERYEVVIVDVPDPSTSQINRFYTREFFNDVAERLTPDGVLCISLGHYENYLSDELANLIAVTHRTLEQEFTKVQVLPGGKIYYLASDGPLTTDVANRLEELGLETKLVGRRYLDAMFSRDRLADVARAISPKAPVNRDFSPVLYYHHLRYWMSQFTVRFGILEGGLLLIFAVSLLRAKPVSLAIFTTGLAASGLEVVLLVGFQILVGSVYHQVGVIITMFMIGLGIGSFTMNRMLGRRTRKDLARLELAMALFAVCVPLTLLALERIQNATIQSVASQVAIPAMALMLAILVGLEFPLAGKADFGGVTTTAARLYTADYLGAALGALLVSTLLIPVIGVIPVCLLAAGLNLASGAVVYWTSRG